MCGDPAGRRAAIKVGGCWRPSRTPARFWLAQALSFHGSLWPKSIVSPSPSRRLGTRLYPAAEFAKAGAATPLAPRVGHGACACGFHVLGCESASKVHGVPAPGSNRADHLAGLRAVPATLYRDNARLGRVGCIAVIGAIAGGGRGAGIGAAVGGGVGTIAGAATTPPRPRHSCHHRAAHRSY
jgi:hypothetical protein